LDAHDVMRLLLLESAVHHLYDAGVIDTDRVAAGVAAEVECEPDGDPAHALENAYRCLAALRRLEESATGG
jgi:hypothetical protein